MTTHASEKDPSRSIPSVPFSNQDQCAPTNREDELALFLPSSPSKNRPSAMQGIFLLTSHRSSAILLWICHRRPHA